MGKLDHTVRDHIQAHPGVAPTKIWDVAPGAEYDEEHDLKRQPSWWVDGTHPIPSWCPFFGWLWARTCGKGLHYTCERLSLPRSKGVATRFIYGTHYQGILTIKDEEEIKRREIKFREAMRPFIEDFDGWWSAAKERMMGYYKELKALDLDTCTENELWWHFHDCMDTLVRMWEVHFDGMYSSNFAWVLFEELCKEWWGMTDSSPEFQKLMIGFDHKMFQGDKRLWQFGQDAMKAGLADIFLTTEAREVIPKLEQTEAGRKWLKSLREFLDEDGWRMERLAEVNEPTWIEDPTPAIANIKAFIAKGGDFVLDEVRERAAKEREEAVAAIMQRVPEEQKEWFLALLRLAQKVGTFMEEHTYYCEFYCFALIRRALLAIGRRWVKAGTVDNVDDIFFFSQEEIESHIFAPEFWDLRYIAERRRKEWEEWLKIPPTEIPPVSTTWDTPEESLMNDVMASMDPIVTKNVIGELPEVRPELKADVYGTRGSHGVAEGVARVIMSLEQLHEVQPGEILIAPNTAPSWTPVFALIKGVVIDRGGMLSHAAIVGREYGIPAVVNTFDATAKIKTGDLIKVNGSEGTVYVLSKSASQ